VSRFRSGIHKRWLVMTLIFGLGPTLVYLAFLHPSLAQISSYREQIRQQASEASLLDLGPVPVSSGEGEKLEAIKRDQLSRIKKVDSRESLLRFSGALTDALAYRARSLGLKVIGARLQTSLISGSYIPADNQAMESLAHMRSPRWEELADPLDLPLLQLPYVEIEMSLASNYSRVFSFIEMLPEFPARVQLTGLRTIEGASGNAYRLTLRGYYFGKDAIKQAGLPEALSAENAF
jgi:hypothetical protein